MSPTPWKTAHAQLSAVVGWWKVNAFAIGFSVASFTVTHAIENHQRIMLGFSFGVNNTRVKYILPKLGLKQKDYCRNIFTVIKLPQICQNIAPFIQQKRVRSKLCEVLLEMAFSLPSVHW